MSNDDLQDFKLFMKQREEAAKAYVSGNDAPLDALSATVAPSTFFGPQGGHEKDPKDVNARYKRDARSFASGDTHFDVLHMGASDGLAYWVGLQRASAQMAGSTEAVEFNLRVTEIFRRDDGNWKLIHRHADALADAKA